MLVSILLVTWNGRRFLERCLPSLVDSLTQVDGVCEVILVDNGSTDGSSAYVAEQFPDVTVIRNGSNVGYAPAMDQALRLAHGEFVAVLNDDTEVDPAWLVELLSVIRSHAQIGSCAPQVRFLHHPTRINSAGITVDRAGSSAERLGSELVEVGEETTVEVFGASGAAALYRRSMLQQVGFYEPLFFAYLEDVDLAWRARRAGWRCLYVPASVIYHVHSGTSGQGSPLKAYLLSRNQIWLVARNASASQLVRYLPYAAARLGAVCLFNAVTRRSVAPMRGIVVALGQLRRVSRMRGRHPFLPIEDFAPLTPPTREFRLRLQRDRLASPRRGG